MPRIIFFAAALAATPALAQNAPPLPPGAPANYPVQRGPYAVTIEADPAMPKHTIYRPTDLSKFAGGKLPIVAWGNGACSNAGRGFQEFLTTIASRGFLIVVAGEIDAPLPQFRAPGPGANPIPDNIPPPATNAAQLTQGIDWAVAENRRPDSRFAGKLATDKIAVMGQSCGGLMALEASADPRVKTSVIFNSGIFPPAPGRPPISKLTKDDLAKLHAPIAYFIGGKTDIAYDNAETDFARITDVPVFKGNLHVGHPGTFWQPNGGWFAEAAGWWLAWQLKGDQAARKQFAGTDCGLCRQSDWVVERKGL